MNLSAMITQLISLFLMMLTGYIAARAGVITADFRKRLSAFTLNTACPGIIISSVLESKSVPSDMIGALGASIFFYLVLMLLAALVVRVFRTKKENIGLDQLMLIFTNVGFMGIPVIQSVYGADGVALLSMFIMSFNIFFFSYGVMLIQRGAKFNPKSLINASIIASLIALLLGITGWHLPEVIENTLASIGAMNTPLAMIIIGSSLAFCSIGETLRNKRLYRIAFLRMLLMPLLMLLVVRFVPMNPMLAGICVIMSAMPIAGNCGMLSDLYTPEDMTASHAVIFTTLLSGVTLPLICALMAAFL